VYSHQVDAALKDSLVSRGAIVSDKVTAGGPTESNVLPFRNDSRTRSAAADARGVQSEAMAEVIEFPARDASFAVLAW
jgi:hypothetical protein